VSFAVLLVNSTTLLVSFAVLLVNSTIDLQGKKGPSRIREGLFTRISYPEISSSDLTSNGVRLSIFSM
jgi:hypothetical protein